MKNQGAWCLEALSQCMQWKEIPTFHFTEQKDSLFSSQYTMHVCEADSKRETVITWIDADVSPYLQYDIAKWLLNAIQADQILLLDSLLFPHRFGLDASPSSLYHIKSELFPCSLSIPILPSPMYCRGFGAELMTCAQIQSIPCCLVCCLPEEVFSAEPVMTLAHFVASFLSVAINEEEVLPAVLSILRRKASVSAYSTVYM
ncbi:hypothetical protein WA577_006222, partial [Blastocystis sp. JDR]